MDSFSADTEKPDKGHLAFVYFAKATVFVGCVLQSITTINGLRSEKLKCRVSACLAPRGAEHVQQLCVKVNNPTSICTLGLLFDAANQEKGKQKNKNKTVDRRTATMIFLRESLLHFLEQFLYNTGRAAKIIFFLHSAISELLVTFGNKRSLLGKSLNERKWRGISGQITVLSKVHLKPQCMI